MNGAQITEANLEKYWDKITEIVGHCAEDASADTILRVKALQDFMDKYGAQSKDMAQEIIGLKAKLEKAMKPAQLTMLNNEKVAEGHDIPVPVALLIKEMDARIATLKTFDEKNETMIFDCGKTISRLQKKAKRLKKALNERNAQIVALLLEDH